ncbi:MAG TPA: hypothetical protein DDW33_09635 [Ktedonobacter sp.]|jgi:hypothetical protein|nr:hypothetical protein [Ktedonobacter sp.]HBE25934.1 hypothetical protein [Ktedonobacter sp.]HBE28689.1 hypothetical protein [Ktedonobacter sp.]HCF84243.1 hypothetical protein [Ktedonobacter sp.]
MIEELAHKGEIQYLTKKKPARLLEALERGIQPGEFSSHVHTTKNTQDTRQEIDKDGRKYWLPYTSDDIDGLSDVQKEEAIP